jgi:hypothetical protein
VVDVESENVRKKTVRFFRASMSNRLNNKQSAIIVVMLRLHEDDVSGDILAREASYCHSMIPMELRRPTCRPRVLLGAQRRLRNPRAPWCARCRFRRRPGI